MKIKHSVSYQTNYEAYVGEQNILDKVMGGWFTWSLMMRSCKGEEKIHKCIFR